MIFPESINNLIQKFSDLPTVGPKTAERYVFYLLKQNQNYLNNFSQSLQDLKKDIKICKNCFSVSYQSLCEICANEKRSQRVICIVANTRDMITIETTKQYHGLYHVLGGLINTIENIKPSDLRINELIEKIKKNKNDKKVNQIQEIIIALDSNLEGETTAMYLSKELNSISNNQIKITRLARGLPMGSNLEYADEMTIINAFQNRTKLV